MYSILKMELKSKIFLKIFYSELYRPRPRFGAATLTLLTQIQGGCTCVAFLAALQSPHSAVRTNIRLIKSQDYSIVALVHLISTWSISQLSSSRQVIMMSF